MKITKVLFKKSYRGEYTSVPISDIPPELLIPENRIMVRVDQCDYSNGQEYEGETEVIITNYREQTEEEKNEMKAHIAELKAKRKEEQYQLYLKLKKEFEN